MQTITPGLAASKLRRARAFQVDALRHRLQVRRVHALRITTQVVQHQTIGDVTTQKCPRGTMGQHRPLRAFVGSDAPIPIQVPRSTPQPAPIRLLDLVPEALTEWNSPAQGCALSASSGSQLCQNAVSVARIPEAVVLGIVCHEAS